MGNRYRCMPSPEYAPLHIYLLAIILRELSDWHVVATHACCCLSGHLSAVSRSRDSGDSKGLIVGAVIGGFVGVMTVATAAYVALRLYRNRTAFSHAHAENKKTALITMGSGP